MPRTALTSNALSAASAPGTLLTEPTPVAADATNGNSAANSGMTMIRIQNTDTASHTLTLITPGNVDGNAIADDPRVIPASGKALIGRLDPRVYGTTLQMTVDSALLMLTVYEP
jgi:hypothetical protein